MDNLGISSHLGLPANSTILESILVALEGLDFLAVDEGTVLTEHVIATMLVDSILRVSSHRTSNYSALLEPDISEPWSWAKVRRFVRASQPPSPITPPQGDTASAYTAVQIHASVRGFVIAAAGGFDYFSVALLTSHVVLSLAFSAWTVLWRRASSDAWESISEMLALAQNSPPPEGSALANTCACFRKWRTSQGLAWVKACTADDMATGNTSSQICPPKKQLRLRFKVAEETKEMSK